MYAKHRLHKWHQQESINMGAKSIAHMHIIAEIKAY